jgi:hypothetical protein
MQKPDLGREKYISALIEIMYFQGWLLLWFVVVETVDFLKSFVLDIDG